MGVYQSRISLPYDSPFHPTCIGLDSYCCTSEGCQRCCTFLYCYLDRNPAEGRCVSY
ncbi:hypothetical protein BDV39DRAFT_59342 [Aspergillus sergii]|uniref:Uncharacterized protein n=1 Tax=Aspergillus sergii TaxID=1034303 RepID=A0A5N6XBL7_9EURO|nr:hypothetical protein BDV39DRAFT_59342 [Aspergillus sergii]